jgi:hypothetical protein
MNKFFIDSEMPVLNISSVLLYRKNKPPYKEVTFGPCAINFAKIDLLSLPYGAGIA